VPVLAELARQVAARGTEREHRRSREEVIERLLLDGIDAEAAGAAVAREHDRIALARAHEAEPALTLTQLAGTRADVALHTSVLEEVPVACGEAVHCQVI